MKILIADDMFSNRLLLKQMIEALGHTCIDVEDGKQAVDYLTENRVDIVMLDIEMPVMNGLETAIWIKEELKLRVPIFSFTAHCTDEYNAKMKKIGFDEIIYKPISIDRLKIVFEKYISQ